MSINSVLFAFTLVIAFGYFSWSVRALVRNIRCGRNDNRFGDTVKRVGNVLLVAFGQTKLLREPLAGVLHVLIFWGFVVLLSAVVESIGEGLVPGFSLAFLGPVYPPLVFLGDLFGVLVVGSAAVSILRRLVAPPKRLQVSGHAKWDAVLILFLILTVMVTMFGQNAARAALGEGSANEFRFVSRELAPLFSGGNGSAWLTFFFWGHMIAVLGFLNYLPNSKHLHVLTSIPNVYFSDLGPKGALAPINLGDEALTKFGATDIDDLTWKQLLNGYTCTECGRCSSVCPARSTGKLLDPKKIIIDVRARTMEKGPVMVAGGAGAGGGVTNQTAISLTTASLVISSPKRNCGHAPPAWRACRSARS